MSNELFQARIPDEFAEKIHEYREERHMSKAEAIRHLLRQGLDAEQGSDDDLDELEARVQEATKQARQEMIADGGVLNLTDHPWVRPLIRLTYSTAYVGLLALLLSVITILAPIGLETVGTPVSATTEQIYTVLTSLGMFAGVILGALSLTGLLTLEYLMHPSEAPISRHLSHQQETEVSG